MFLEELAQIGCVAGMSSVDLPMKAIGDTAGPRVSSPLDLNQYDLGTILPGPYVFRLTVVPSSALFGRSAMVGVSGH